MKRIHLRGGAEKMMSRERLDHRLLENNNYQHRRVILETPYLPNRQPRENLRLTPFFNEARCSLERYLNCEPLFFGSKNLWEERVLLSSRTKQELMKMRHLSPMELVGYLWEINPKVLDQVLDRKQSRSCIEGIRVDLAVHLSVFVLRLKLKSGRYITASANSSRPAVQGLFSRVIAFLLNEPELARRCFWNWNYVNSFSNNGLWFTEAAQDLWKCRNDSRLQPISLPTGFLAGSSRGTENRENRDVSRRLEDRLGYDVSRVHDRVRSKSVAPDMLRTRGISTTKSDCVKSSKQNVSKYSGANIEKSEKSVPRSRGFEALNSNKTTVSKETKLKIDRSAFSKPFGTARPRSPEPDVVKASRSTESNCVSTKASQPKFSKYLGSEDAKSSRSDLRSLKTPELDASKPSQKSKPVPSKSDSKCLSQETDQELAKLKSCSITMSASTAVSIFSDSKSVLSSISLESKYSDVSNCLTPDVVRSCSVSQFSGMSKLSSIDNPKSSKPVISKDLSQGTSKLNEPDACGYTDSSKCAGPPFPKLSCHNFRMSKSADPSYLELSACKDSKLPASPMPVISQSDAPKLSATALSHFSEHNESIFVYHKPKLDGSKFPARLFKSEPNVQKSAPESTCQKNSQTFGVQKLETKVYSADMANKTKVEGHPKIENNESKSANNLKLLVDISSSDDEVEHKTDLLNVPIPKNDTSLRPILNSQVPFKSTKRVVSKSKSQRPLPPKGTSRSSRMLLRKFASSVAPGGSQSLGIPGKDRELIRIRAWRNRMIDQVPVAQLRSQFPKKNYSLLMFNRFAFVENIRYETTLEEPEEPEIDDKVTWWVELKFNRGFLKFYGQSKLRWDKAFNNAIIIALNFCSRKIVHEKIIPRHLRNETQFLVHCFLNPEMKNNVSGGSNLPEVELKRKRKLVHEQSVKRRKRAKSVGLQIDDSNDEISTLSDGSNVFEVTLKTENMQYCFEKACYRRKKALDEGLLQVLRSTFDYFVM